MEPIVCTLYQSFSRAAPDEVTERVDSGGDLEEDELSSVGNPLFEDPEKDGSVSAGDSEEDGSVSAEDPEEDGSGSAGDSEDEPDDPQVQEEVSVIEMVAFPIAPRCVTS